MNESRGSLVAIGVGNVLLGDDGVGVRVIECLRALAAGDPEAIPAGTTFVDGGTLGLQLLPWLRGARGVLVVDAADLGGLPGAVSVRRDTRAWTADSDVQQAGGATGAAGVAELLGTARLLGLLPPALSVVGIGVEDLGPGLGLSDRVAAALPRAIRVALRELLVLDARAACEPQPAGATA